MMKALNYDDPESVHFQRASQSPAKPLRELKAGKTVHQESHLQSSTLSNGIRVVSLNEVQPNVVDLGILMDIGTRDETIETSGTMLALKNTFLKTAMNTNETINYGMVQMSGGEFGMEYDQESCYYKAHCLSHDVVDIVGMMMDCALEPKTAVTADLAQYKNQESLAHEKRVNTGLAFNNALFQLAYGLKGLGLPLMGLENHKNLTAASMQRFQLDHVRPENMIVCGAGVRNHQELVELVEFKLASLGVLELTKGHGAKREKSVYVGGEQRLVLPQNDVQWVLAFETQGWNAQQMYVSKVVQALLGDSAHSRNARLRNNLVLSQNVVDSAKVVNFSFSDSGLFGVQCQGPADKGQKALEAVIQELKGLSKVNAKDLASAKASVVGEVLSVLDNQGERLEEAVKNVKVFGQDLTGEYVQGLHSVSAQQVQQFVADLLKGAPTFVLQGGMVNQMHSLDKINNALKL